jgi:hypothetical protein
MPAYYDAQLFTFNFKEEPGGAEQALLAHNGSINTIYMCDACEAAGVMFTTVLDAIQGDGFNPLWREVQITFNAGHAPRQLFSDNEVADAAAAGEITLAPTRSLPLLGDRPEQVALDGRWSLTSIARVSAVEATRPPPRRRC